MKILGELEVKDGKAVITLKKEGHEAAVKIEADSAELVALLTELTPTKIDDKIVPFLGLLKSHLNVPKITKVLKE